MSNVIITAPFVYQTGKAILLQVGERQVWIPKSLVENIDEIPDEPEKNEELTLEIPEWFAEKAEIIDECEYD